MVVLLVMSPSDADQSVAARLGESEVAWTALPDLVFPMEAPRPLMSSCGTELATELPKADASGAARRSRSVEAGDRKEVAAMP
jgi:hypothetical protein